MVHVARFSYFPDGPGDCPGIFTVCDAWFPHVRGFPPLSFFIPPMVSSDVCLDSLRRAEHLLFILPLTLSHTPSLAPPSFHLSES